ncbi:FKBP-type peptidyl-prolyl cis-trans isomerase [bacterium]|nr:FKBP-type peptidyl-prolyl cis-trans isomerase [bacterium]
MKSHIEKIHIQKFATAVFIAAIALSACTKKKPGEAESTNAAGGNTQVAMQATPPPKVEVSDISSGKGTEAVAGKSVTVHYTGTLKDGTKFDSSVDRKQPFTFTLGKGEVIKGWDQGVIGMKIGGKRKLSIPPELAYGSNAVGAIPANSTLFFEIELLEVKDVKAAK